jgi:cell division protein FtsN
MPRDETGEFEVLLGNKQLLSIFVIVVILLGVFFTMGYIFGRKSNAPEAASAQAKTAAPPAGQLASQKPESAFGDSATPQAQEPVTQTATPPVEPPKEKAEAPAPLVPQPPPAAEPAPGQTYLQVVAVKKPEAEVVADVLRKKGFHCVVAPHPDQPIFRVLVGPLEDADDLAKTRSALLDLNAGFKPIVRKF